MSLLIIYYKFSILKFYDNFRCAEDCVNMVGKTNLIKTIKYITHGYIRR